MHKQSTNYHTPPSVYSISGCYYSGVPVLFDVYVDFDAEVF